MNCPACHNLIEEARLELGLTICLSCARSHPTPKYRGAMVYGHKTAGAICLMSPEEFTRYKKVTNRRGQQSVLRNVLHANGRAV